jgi:hypothetical protein
MRQCKLTLLTATLVLIALGFSLTAHAWEMNISGTMNWKYEYYAQQGNRGFFGPYDISNQPGPIAVEAQSNAWLGIETLGSLFHGKHPGIVTGSDASRSVIFAEFYPEFKVNRAVSIHGMYRIGGHGAGNDDILDEVFEHIGPGYNTEYVNSLVPGRKNAFAFGGWTMLWADLLTPWGDISYGKKPFSIGCGLAYNSEDATEESLLLVAPFGPFRFGAGFYPMTLGQTDFFDIMRRQQDVYAALIFELPDYYGDNAFWDQSGHPIKVMAFSDYSSGALNVGVGSRYTRVHLGGEGRPRDQGPFWPTIDQTDWEGWLYSRYTNGRIFLNSELDFFNRVRTMQRTLNGTIGGAVDPADGGGSAFAPKYVESWRFMVETGLLIGPAKITFLYSWLPGPDRRHGVLIDRQPTTYPYEPSQFPGFSDVLNQEASRILNQHTGNAGVFRPYSLLLSNDYGAGVNCIDLNGNGCMTDASVLAMRVDYAIAANLNLSSSFLYAERVSHGWQWGCIRPAHKRAAFIPRQSFVNEFGRPIPTVPDTSLGWEAGLGLDWQILDGWNVSGNAAYWQPGRWFNYACVDRSVENWIIPSPTNNWGVNPDRVIEPIFGLKVFTTVTF